MDLNINHKRHGITLMEVLISIGILSIGLTAVVSLIPAGGSEAKKAIIEDRKAHVALAALDDAITRGILNPGRWSTIPAVPYTCVFEPLGGVTLGLTAVDVLGLSASSLPATEVFRGQDDVFYTLQNSGDDGPPQPVYFSGNTKRLSEGNYSWLATLVPYPAVPTGSANPSQNCLLSVCVCYRRPIPGEISPTTFALTAPAAAGLASRSVTFDCVLSRDDFRRLFPRGSVVFLVDGTNGGVETHDWRRIIFASLDTTQSPPVAELMFDRDTLAAAGATLYTIEGAVGVAERIVRLEEVSPWTQ